MTDKAKIREALERIDFHCQPGDDAGNIEWWVTVNGECKGGTKIGHGSIIMRAFMDWKRARDEALALLDAERPKPSVPVEVWVALEYGKSITKGYSAKAFYDAEQALRIAGFGVKE